MSYFTAVVLYWQTWNMYFGKNTFKPSQQACSNCALWTSGEKHTQHIHLEHTTRGDCSKCLSINQYQYKLPNIDLTEEAVFAVVRSQCFKLAVNKYQKQVMPSRITLKNSWPVIIQLVPRHNSKVWNTIPYNEICTGYTVQKIVKIALLSAQLSGESLLNVVFAKVFISLYLCIYVSICLTAHADLQTSMTVHGSSKCSNSGC